jgi:hypothetical protein
VALSPDIRPCSDYARALMRNKSYSGLASLQDLVAVTGVTGVTAKFYYAVTDKYLI